MPTRTNPLFETTSLGFVLCLFYGKDYIGRITLYGHLESKQQSQIAHMKH